jgi:hypothetical protein
MTLPTATTVGNFACATPALSIHSGHARITGSYPVFSALLSSLISNRPENCPAIQSA